ncbi:hypothetical protein KIPB_011487, partial [Kipferlia bialata]|eukprot:g11487.t1
MFTPIQIPKTSLTAQTRFIRSAVALGQADNNGVPDEVLIERYCELAESRVGIIMAGHAYVTEQGKAHLRQVGMHDDAVIPAHRAILTAVKEKHPDVLIFSQLAHAGLPSLAKYTKGVPLTMESDKAELEKVPAAMAAAALRAVECGYDGVQIHSGHGYLLASSLSPYMNKRTDEFKCGPELLKRVVTAVSEALPAGFPLAIKMNVTDGVDNS